jgi:hypothetical protein
MDLEAGGWLWLIIDIAFVLALAAALIYGMSIWRRRKNRALEEVRDHATDRLYGKQ